MAQRRIGFNPHAVVDVPSCAKSAKNIAATEIKNAACRVAGTRDRQALAALRGGHVDVFCSDMLEAMQALPAGGIELLAVLAPKTFSRYRGRRLCGQRTRRRPRVAHRARVLHGSAGLTARLRRLNAHDGAGASTARVPASAGELRARGACARQPRTATGLAVRSLSTTRACAQVTVTRRLRICSAARLAGGGACVDFASLSAAGSRREVMLGTADFRTPFAACNCVVAPMTSTSIR